MRLLVCAALLLASTAFALPASAMDAPCTLDRDPESTTVGCTTEDLAEHGCLAYVEVSSAGVKPTARCA